MSPLITLLIAVASMFGISCLTLPVSPSQEHLGAALPCKCDQITAQSDYGCWSACRERSISRLQGRADVPTRKNESAPDVTFKASIPNKGEDKATNKTQPTNTTEHTDQAQLQPMRLFGNKLYHVPYGYAPPSPYTDDPSQNPYPQQDSGDDGVLSPQPQEPGDASQSQQYASTGPMFCKSCRVFYVAGKYLPGFTSGAEKYGSSIGSVALCIFTIGIIQGLL